MCIIYSVHSRLRCTPDSMEDPLATLVSIHISVSDQLTLPLVENHGRSNRRKANHMNRRDFLGTVVGGVAAVKLGAAGLGGYNAQPTASESTSQGAWIRNGLIDAGGLHEPLIFVVRRGGQSLDARETYEYEQSEEVIRQLKHQGVDVFHTHLYKGFGMTAEQPEMEDAIRTAAIVHRYGMKVDSYVQWDALMYETFFAEEPAAIGWIQIDALGQPIMTPYGYQQSFRYRPCFSNQAYIDYLKRVVRYAVLQVKTDFIHFDNFDLNAEPESCHCDACKTGFRKYLQTKHTPAERKERFGFQNVDYVNPPLWNRENPPGNLDIIYDPVLQEWIDYRCRSMADALGQLAAEIAALNPNVVVEINFGGLAGQNNPWLHGANPPLLLKHTQVFWDEQDGDPAYLPDGRLITTIRTYKMARTCQNIAFTTGPSSQSGSEVAIGESLAFNQTIGFAGVNPLSPEMLKYISFYQKNRDLYIGTKDVAAVAVLHSFPSITYHHSRAGLSAILVEQALIEAKVPFHLIFDEDLGQLSPDMCKVLILPNSECLSDEQLRLIRRFVQSGGGLIATEQAGHYDAWRRLRSRPGLEGLVDGQRGASAYEQEVVISSPAAAAPIKKQFGGGRVVYIPAIEFDGPLPSFEPYFNIGNAFWKRPRNWKQLIDAVLWTSGGNVQLQVTGPDYLAANLVEQPEKRRRLVHLVNYNAKNQQFLEGIEVTCGLPEAASARSIDSYSADSDTSRNLKFLMQGSRAVFTVPRFHAYCMAAINW